MERKIIHSSIGENVRRVHEQVAQAIEKRKEIIARYNETPWRKYGVDQLSVWAVWFTLAVSLFLFCTVSAVVIAVR